MLDTKSTELEETSSQLHRANTQLKAFNSLKDGFLSTISHKLHPPLHQSKRLVKSYIKTMVRQSNNVNNFWALSQKNVNV